MVIDFNKLKTEISLPDFLLALGWKFVKGSSNSRPKMSNGDHTIVIKKNPKEQYTYWDVHTSDVYGRSIIDLMRQHLFETTGEEATLREAGEAIMRFMATNEVVQAGQSRFKVGQCALTEAELMTIIHQLETYNGDYLQKRGISKEALSSLTFSDTFFIRKYKKNKTEYRNVCVKMFDDKRLKGISQRNDEYKGVQGEKFDSLAFSHHDASRPIDTVYIGESMVDCISHFQIKNLDNPENILYASSEGTLTKGQLILLKKLVDRHNIKKIISIFDNDENGHKYYIWLDNFFNGKNTETENLSEEELKAIAESLPDTDIPSLKDWNEVLMDMQGEPKGK